MRRLGVISSLVAVVVLSASTASAKVFLTSEEALKLAFPGCKVTRKTLFLTASQLQDASARAGAKVTSALVNPYVASCSGRPTEIAYFDSHRVRTLPQTLMIVIDEANRVRRIEVLSFAEPEDYLPKPAWYAQFTDKVLAPALELKRDIRGVAGATLTARATMATVRRVLATHLVIKSARLVP